METYDERMQSVGFTLPPGTYEKPDPRGPEYGQFHASVMPSGKVNVVWHGTHGKTYTMLFASLDNFEAWAKECT
jgi:hypothetical protein